MNLKKQVHRTDIQVRFNDTDALGHINNSSYALYAEVGRLELLKHIDVLAGNFILAALNINFRLQGTFLQKIYVETYIEKIGNSSIVMNHDIYADEKIAADANSVIVHFDYETNQSQRVPEYLRQRLKPFIKQ